MRLPLRVKGSPRAPVSAVTTIPAPVGGWNARDALSAMPSTDAITLVNFYPETSSCDLRGGSLEPRTGSPDPTTLMVYTSLTGSSALFCVGSSLVDVSTYTGFGSTTTSITTPSGLQTSSLTPHEYSWTMFGDGTTNYLIAVNGVDAPLYYDGATWKQVDSTTSPALSGVTVTTLMGVNVFKGRLFFVQKDTLSFWYLASGAAGGALTEFDLSAEAKRGGSLVAMTSWTRDGGDGLDDVAVFLTSEGEAIVYQGNNPSSANTWAKVGTFFVGRPLGRRCLLQFGGDVLILTDTGVFPLSSALQAHELKTPFAVSFKIERAFVDAARLYSGNPGWRMIHYPQRHALIVNVPVTGESEQYVMNTITKAWCKFTQWHALDWAIYQGNLFFVQRYNAIGFVLQAWHGPTDYPTHAYAVANPTATTRPKTANGTQAFHYLASPVQKQIKQLRTILSVNGNLDYQVDCDTDYQTAPFSGTVQYRSSSALWDEAEWDEAYWDDDFDMVQQWTVPSCGTGLAIAPKISLETSTIDVSWLATDLSTERGGLL